MRATKGDQEYATGVELIAAERQRQIDDEGWTPDHDESHTGAELGRAAECYVAAARDQTRTFPGKKPKYRRMWPWEREWWKPSDDPIRNLVKAGALIAAEIDRLSRTRKEV